MFKSTTRKCSCSSSPRSAGDDADLTLGSDGLWYVRPIPGFQPFSKNAVKRYSIPKERRPEFWADKQAGVKIRELQEKYGVSWTTVVVTARRIRAGLAEGKGLFQLKI